MKKVLITGANSYIGNAVQKHLNAAGYDVSVLDMRSEDWRGHDFSGYESVFHVAGIAHEKEKKENEQLYFKINRDLAIETAKKAETAGVKQFVFLSSMSIYAGHGNTNITVSTVYKPKGYYGQSKLEADLALQKINSDNFKVAVLRPPMIFGKDCKGNFPRLVDLSLKAPLFPKVKNQRSMLHIDNLCAIVEIIIQNCESGIFFPQNPDYFCTTDLAVKTAELNGKKLKTTRLFNWAVWSAYPFMPQIKKLFGNLTYDKSISNHFDGEYWITDNDKSIEASV